MCPPFNMLENTITMSFATRGGSELPCPPDHDCAHDLPSERQCNRNTWSPRVAVAYTQPARTTAPLKDHGRVLVPGAGAMAVHSGAHVPVVVAQDTGKADRRLGDVVTTTP